MSYSIDASTDNCYPGTTCLINKFNIRDEKLLSEVESEITFAKASMLEQSPLEGSFDFEHLKSIHKFLFEDIYDWAGKIRDVDINKKTTRFLDHKQINEIGYVCLEKISNGYLDGIDRNEFIKRIAELYNDVNYIHPFREGNGRAQRIFFAQLIRSRGYDIDFSNVDTDYLMIATIQATQGVMDFLIDFFDSAIIQDRA